MLNEHPRTYLRSKSVSCDFVSIKDIAEKKRAFAYEVCYNNSMRDQQVAERKSQRMTDEAKQTDERSHYAKYKSAHQKYEKSEKGSAAREKYMSSEKGKSTRKRYMKKRYEEQKKILKAAKAAGIGK